MPYPNEHSCQLADPDQFDRFNRVDNEQKHDGKPIDVVYGIKEGKSEIQALRYRKETWSAEAARSHCSSRKGTFEVATGKKEEAKLRWLRAAEDLGLQAPEWFKIFPAGEVLIDGEEPAIMDSEGADLVISHFEDRSNDMVIDYEHQTLTRQKAPAAGWIQELQWREGDGLWARATWTEEAAAYIQKREYRYFSPVFWVRADDRKIIELYNVALTNQPLMMNIEALAAKHEADVNQRRTNMEQLKKLLGLAESATETECFQAVETLVSAKKEALEALGLKETATKEDIVKAIQTKMKGADDEPVACKEVLEVLGQDEKATVEQVVAAVQKLKDKSGKATDVEAELKTLKEAHEGLNKKWNERDRDERVDRAIKAGKLAPAQKDWALEYALKDPAGFDAFIEKQPQVIPLEELKTAEGVEGGTASQRIEKLISKKMAEDKELGYDEAMNLVSKENPELAQEYLNEGRASA